MDICEAAKRGDTEAVQELISADKDLVHQSDEMGFSALHWAASSRHEGIVRLLLLNGANSDKRNNAGDTALHLGVWRDHPEVVSILIHSNVNVIDVLNSNGKSPLDLIRSEEVQRIFDAEEDQLSDHSSDSDELFYDECTL